MKIKPIKINCKQGKWTKVENNFKYGKIYKIEKSPTYLFAHRDTGGVAPSEKDEGIPMFQKSNVEIIDSNEEIDGYIFCVESDGIINIDVH